MAPPRSTPNDRVPTAIRLPRHLHERAAKIAAERDTSVTNLITKGLELYLDNLPPLEVLVLRKVADG